MSTADYDEAETKVPAKPQVVILQRSPWIDPTGGHRYLDATAYKVRILALTTKL